MADDCTNAFSKQISGSKTRVTTSVNFNSKKLAKWLQQVAPHCSQIQVRFGTYTKAHALTKELEGRTTVFFYACDENGELALDESGNEIPPVNQGTVFP